MNLIPSFILSTLFFCTVSVPGGFDGATLTEGVICEIPYTSFVLSVEENPLDMQPELKNAACIFEQEALSLKLAAGTLAVSGTGGSVRLSANLPGKEDARKDISFFARWKNLALLGSKDRAVFQFSPGFFRILPDATIKTELAASLTAGWTPLSEPSDTSWFLRYPWHGNGNLYYLDGGLSARLSFKGAKLTAAGTASLSMPDILPPEAGGAFKLLFETSRTKTTLLYAATPPSFVMPTGSFPTESILAEAAFSLDTGRVALSADTEAAQKQPEHALALSEWLHSATVSAAYKTGNFRMGASVKAAKLCFADACRDAELSPELELSLSGTNVCAKATFLPFRPEEEAESPVWRVKATRTFSGITASYTAEISGTWLEKQEFSLEEERDTISLKTFVTVKDDSLIWNLSFSKKW